MQFLRGGGAVTLELDSKPATIPLSTYAVAGDWLRLVFKDNNDTYEYETAKQWSKESAESDTPSPLPPVEGNDGQLLMSQNGQWAPVDAEGGFGYLDTITIFEGTVTPEYDSEADTYGFTTSINLSRTELESIVSVTYSDILQNSPITVDMGDSWYSIDEQEHKIKYGLRWNRDLQRCELQISPLVRSDGFLLEWSPWDSGPFDVSIKGKIVHPISNSYIFPPITSGGDTHCLQWDDTNGWHAAPIAIKIYRNSLTNTYTSIQPGKLYEFGHQISPCYSLYDDRHNTTTYYVTFLYRSASNKLTWANFAQLSTATSPELTTTNYMLVNEEENSTGK